MADALVGIGMVGMVTFGTMLAGLGWLPALTLGAVAATVYQLVIAMQE